MSAVRVVRVDDSNWRTYRDVRLTMLRDHPRAFGSTYAETSQRTDDDWQSFATGAWLWLAYADPAGDPSASVSGAVGSIGMWPDPELPAGSTYLVGMWVHADHRGHGVADALVRQVLDTAVEEGFTRVVLDVADENARAVAFYARMSFTPTGVTGHLPWDSSITESEYERLLG